MSKNKKIIILILLLVIGTVGTTIAYFKQSQKINNEITSDEYIVSYNYDFIKDSSWNPGDIDEPNINVKNEGEIPIIVRAKMSETWTDENGNDLSLLLNNNERVVVKTINTNWFKDGNYYYYYKELNSNDETNSIIDYIIYNSNAINNGSCTATPSGTTCNINNDYSNATYKLSINFETIQKDAAEKEWNINLDKPKSLYNLIEQQTIYDDITSPTVTDNIKINTISSYTNGNGIFTYHKTVNEPFTYNYYRGNVNNNIIFANSCWKIIGTTTSGNIKIIYNGQSNNGICDNKNENSGISYIEYNLEKNDQKYVGYKYTTITNDDTDSNIKYEIDKWYENNLKNYSNYLADEKYLCERDGEPGSFFPFAFVGRIRIWGNNSQGHAYNVPNTYIRFGTPYENDIFTVANGKLKYPIALLTTDEAILAGLRGTISSEDSGNNPDNYLTNGISYWLMTPAEKYNDRATMTYVYNNGSLGGSLSVSSQILVRPVTALNHNIKYSSGNGTINNPYIISE